MRSLKRLSCDLHDIAHELAKVCAVKGRAPRQDSLKRRAIPRLAFVKTFIATKVLRKEGGVRVVPAGHAGNLSYGRMVRQERPMGYK